MDLGSQEAQRKLQCVIAMGHPGLWHWPHSFSPWRHISLLKNCKSICYNTEAARDYHHDTLINYSLTTSFKSRVHDLRYSQRDVSLNLPNTALVFLLHTTFHFPLHMKKSTYYSWEWWQDYDARTSNAWERKTRSERHGGIDIDLRRISSSFEHHSRARAYGRYESLWFWYNPEYLTTFLEEFIPRKNVTVPLRNTR